MTTAYLIVGAPSSGNRMLTAALVRSGCVGDTGVKQPQNHPDWLIPPPGDKPLVFFSHPNAHDKTRTLEQWVQATRDVGYTRVVLVFLFREPVAYGKSNVARTHYSTPQAALKARLDIYIKSFGELAAGTVQADQVEIVTYEGITEAFLREWLPRIGLKYRSGPLNLPGQNAPTIQNQNSKHYR